jgi:hypothetical protein
MGTKRKSGIDRTSMSREEYALEYLVNKFGLSERRARELIQQLGTDLVKLKAAVLKV